LYPLGVNSRLYATEVLGKVILSRTACPSTKYIRNILLKEGSNVTLKDIQQLMGEFVLPDFNNMAARESLNWLVECVGLVDLHVYDLLRQESLPEV
jgi:hypothetical protein